jgi:ketosteroid isomerase-like protein
MIVKMDMSFGPDSRDRLDEAMDPSGRGAEAVLESFYYAWHSRDPIAMRACWSTSPLAQIDSPVGGIVRGGDAIVRLYERAVVGSTNLRATFHDVIAYHGTSHVVFAGRETGSYTAPDGSAESLEIRCTRYFRYEDGHWRQYHHHGSIGDPDALRAFQEALGG